MVEPQEDEPMAEPFGPDDDIAGLAYQHARQLNGHSSGSLTSDIVLC